MTKRNRASGDTLPNDLAHVGVEAGIIGHMHSGSACLLPCLPQQRVSLKTIENTGLH